MKPRQSSYDVLDPSWLQRGLDRLAQLSFITRKGDRYFTELGEDVTDKLTQLLHHLANDHHTALYDQSHRDT